jgi:hypothetical protein
LELHYLKAYSNQKCFISTSVLAIYFMIGRIFCIKDEGKGEKLVLNNKHLDFFLFQFSIG